MAEILAGNSIEKWEIEDAQIYHPVWLRPYMNYLNLDMDLLKEEIRLRYNYDSGKIAYGNL